MPQAPSPSRQYIKSPVASHGEFLEVASANPIAAVEASIFFSLDADGELVCELDSWPQDE